AAGHDCLLTCRDFGVYDKLPLALMSGEPQHVLKQLLAGEVVVGSVLAQHAKLSEGSMVELVVDKDKHTFRVAGVCNEYSLGGLTAYLDGATAQKVFNIPGVDGYLITTEHPTPADVPAKLTQYANGEGLLLHSFTQIRARIDDMVAGVVAGLWILLALGLLVG